MSLINDMLKNLDKRETKPHAMPYIVLADHRAKTKFFHRYLLISSLLGVFCLTLAGLFLLFHAHKASLSLPKHNQKTTPHAAATLHAATPPSVRPAIISGVTLQEKENMTEVALLLDHPVSYQIIRDDKAHQTTLVILQSTMLAELPPINYPTAVLKQLNVINKDGNTYFTFTLYPGSVIKRILLQSNNNKPELVVSLTQENKLAAPLPAPTHGPIKKAVMSSLFIEQYQVALNEIENGQYEAAINHLSTLLQANPAYQDARVSLAALLLDQGKFQQAKILINAGLMLNPNNVPLTELKARALTNEGKIQQALSLLTTISPPLEDNPDYYAFLAALYSQSNKNNLSINLYQQLLSFNPHNGSWWLGLGISFEKLNQDQQALNAYSKAMTEGHLNPESIAFLQDRIQALQEYTHGQA